MVRWLSERKRKRKLRIDPTPERGRGKGGALGGGGIQGTISKIGLFVLFLNIQKEAKVTRPLRNLIKGGMLNGIH